MADKSSMPMGRRQKARIAQRRRRRLIGAGVIVLICLLIFFLVWMSREKQTNAGGDETVITSSVTENNEGLTLPELQPENTDIPEETLPVETIPNEETEPPEETEPVQETPAQEPETSAPVQAPGAGTANNGGTGTTNTGSGNQGTTNTGNSGTTNTGSTGSSGSTGGQTQKPTETVTLKSGTLSCNVTTATQGGQGKLTWKALDSKGNDITSKCTITYKTSNCTVQGSTVTFPTAGAASITGTITYNGASVTTNTVTVNVTAPPAPEPKLASVKLAAPAETARQGETAQLTVTALDDSGKDITGDCTITYTASGCTVEGGTVTFGTMGTAAVTASVTYKGVTLTTETAKVTVIGPLASVTLTYTPDKTENTSVSAGDTATLSAKAVDANGTEVPGCTIIYTASGAKVEDSKVTFNQGGKVTITASAAEGEVTVTSNTVTVYVDFQVMLSKAGNLTVPMGQHVTNSRFGWYVCLPTLAAKVVEKDADGKEIVSDSQATYRYDTLGMTVSVSSADRAEEDQATLEELYTARTKVLTDEGATLLAQVKPTEAGYYQITWQKEDTVTTERRYVGSASETTLTASYPLEKRESAEQLLTIIASTFQNGNLNTAHPAQ